MITRKEYNKALDIVEAYHKQIFFNKDNEIKKTPLLEWDKVQICSNRLYRVLEALNHYNYVHCKNYFIENMIWGEFAKQKGAGKKTWDEFTKLRGY